jgi:hypothetical protein
MKAAGRNIHLIDTEALTSGPARFRAPLDPGARVGYRGWMLTQGEYVNLAASVERADGSCSTSPEEYVATHYLPNWYPIVKDYAAVLRPEPNAVCRRARRDYPGTRGILRRGDSEHKLDIEEDD